MSLRREVETRPPVSPGVAALIGAFAVVAFVGVLASAFNVALDAAADGVAAEATYSSTPTSCAAGEYRDIRDDGTWSCESYVEPVITSTTLSGTTSTDDLATWSSPIISSSGALGNWSPATGDSTFYITGSGYNDSTVTRDLTIEDGTASVLVYRHGTHFCHDDETTVAVVGTDVICLPSGSPLTLKGP